MTRTIDRGFPAGPLAAKEARMALDELVEELPARCLDDIRLLVSELVTNSVRHANLPTDASVGMRVRVSPRSVVVEVTDAGAGFEPRHIDPSMYSTSGWGLYLVEQIADRWGVEAGRAGRAGDETRVWFELDRGAAFSPCSEQPA